MHPYSETAAAIEQAKSYPSSGVTVNKVSPDKPNTASWVGGNRKRIYVGKRVFCTGTIRGFATDDPCEASGYKTVHQAQEDMASLGYVEPWIEYCEYKGQLKLF